MRCGCGSIWIHINVNRFSGLNPMVNPECALTCPEKWGTDSCHDNVANHLQKSSCPKGRCIVFPLASPEWHCQIFCHIVSHVTLCHFGVSSRLLQSTRSETEDTWTTLVCCQFSSERPCCSHVVLLESCTVVTCAEGFGLFWCVNYVVRVHK